MHLVILAEPRSGSHMLASMIGGVTDIGCPTIPIESLTGRLLWDADSPEAFYRAEDSGGVVLSNLKIGNFEWWEPVDGAVAAGAKLLLLGRRDKLAGWCSLCLARAHGLGWLAPSPAGLTITIDPTDAAMEVAGWHVEATRAVSRYPQAARLIYEDLTAAAVQAALGQLGLDLPVGEPTTEKLSPPLEHYVRYLR